jgi:SAM-dependent methyltransferase
MDAVFVGQAVHWFDVPVACREIGRVLRAGGGVALLRNDWPAVEQAPSWLVELRAVLGSRAPGEEPARAPYGGGRWQQAIADSSVFEQLESASVEHAETIAVDSVLAQIASWSFFDASGLEREKLTRDSERVLRAHAGPGAEATVTVPYLTQLRWARRAEPS